MWPFIRHSGVVVTSRIHHLGLLVDVVISDAVVLGLGPINISCLACQPGQFKFGVNILITINMLYKINCIGVKPVLPLLDSDWPTTHPPGEAYSRLNLAPKSKWMWLVHCGVGCPCLQKVWPLILPIRYVIPIYEKYTLPRISEFSYFIFLWKIFIENGSDPFIGEKKFARIIGFMVFKSTG